MRLTIRHETIYTYSTPARGVIQTLRLQPRNHDGQFVRRWRIDIDADCRVDRDEDAFGNITHTFTAEGAFTQLSVIAEGTALTSETGGLVKGTAERFPLSFWLRSTPLTEAKQRIRDFARLIAAGEGGDRLSLLHSLNTQLHREFSFVIGDTHAATTAEEAFAQRCGVCQDLAHVFIACARALGIPARYVGGYYMRTDTIYQEAGHAWAEAHVPGLGWIGFDPANGVCVTERHVRVASGLDYLDAAPVRGARLGGSDETLAVTVEVGAKNGATEPMRQVMGAGGMQQVMAGLVQQS